MLLAPKLTAVTDLLNSDIVGVYWRGGVLSEGGINRTFGDRGRTQSVGGAASEIFFVQSHLPE